MKNKDKNSVCAKLIKKIRLSACMTQKQFAQKINVNMLSVTFYENGLRVPRIDKLKNIIDFAKNLGINVNYFDFEVEE